MHYYDRNTPELLYGGLKRSDLESCMSNHNLYLDGMKQKEWVFYTPLNDPCGKHRTKHQQNERLPRFLVIEKIEHYTYDPLSAYCSSR
jgi:hypothetical protein